MSLVPNYNDYRRWVMSGWQVFAVTNAGELTCRMVGRPSAESPGTYDSMKMPVEYFERDWFGCELA